MEQRPTPVTTAKQVGDATDPRIWAEPTVWTERLLTALEQGVKGGVWFSLHEERGPVSYFADQGLFSLKAAPGRFVNPL